MIFRPREDLRSLLRSSGRYLGSLKSSVTHRVRIILFASLICDANLSSVRNLHINPVPEGVVLHVENRHLLKEWEEPRYMAKQADAQHSVVQRVQIIVLHASF